MTTAHVEYESKRYTYYGIHLRCKYIDPGRLNLSEVDLVQNASSNARELAVVDDVALGIVLADSISLAEYILVSSPQLSSCEQAAPTRRCPRLHRQ